MQISLQSTNSNNGARHGGYNSNPVKQRCAGPFSPAFGAAATSYGRALISLQDMKSDENLIYHCKNIVATFLPNDVNIHYPNLNLNKGVIRFKAGEEFADYKGLYKDDYHICGYLNNKAKPKNIYILNKKTQEIDVIDLENSFHLHYNADEVKALHDYKYHPEAIHLKLRHGKDKYSGSWKEENDKTIDVLTNLFNNEEKTYKNKENITLYRALQPDLTDEERKQLMTVGAVYTDKSFCSTSTTYENAKRFNGQSNFPILEINFPKDAEYIDVEKIFNIDRNHWNETEYLLNRNSSFKITGFDEKNNIIKADYILK